MEEQVFWIFGYGSLIWRPSFEYVHKIDGFIKGWRRGFFQASTDHRGVPEKPGRVVTLLQKHEYDLLIKGKTNDFPDEEEFITWGTAYAVLESKRSEVISYLDYREKGGYSQSSVDVYIPGQDSPKVQDALIYVATPSNHQFLGIAPLDDMAHQIISCHGPSGANLEYLFKLTEALNAMNAKDSHVFTVYDRVKHLLANQNNTNQSS